MEDKIKTLLVDKLRHFYIFSELTNEKTIETKQLKDISEETQNSKIDTILYNVELSYIFNELITMILLSKELGITLPKEILDFMEKYNSSFYKRKFSVEGRNIVEVEKGFLEEGRQKFLESDMMKLMNKTLEQ